jgi:hypothetical protein
MDIYNYDPPSGRFAGARTANIDPLETQASGEDRYAIAAYATPDAPPATGEHQGAVFRAADGTVPADYRRGGWAVVPDYSTASVCEIAAEGYFVGRVEMALGEGLTASQVLAEAPRGDVPLPRWDAGQWVDGRTLDERRDDLLAAVAPKRFEIETGGITVSGIQIFTDREAQATLNGGLTALREGFVDQTPWKAAGGIWVDVTLAEITPITNAVARHVRACFTAERAHCQAIAVLETIEEIEGYNLESGWPGTVY